MAVRLVVRGFNTEIPPHKGVTTSIMKLVYCLLLDRASEDGQQCFPSLDEIAKRAQVSRSVVQNCIDGLIANGFIEKARTRKLGGSLYGSNDYIINLNKLDDSINYRKTVSDIPPDGNCHTVRRYHQVPRDGIKPVIQPVNEPVIKPVGKKSPKSKSKKPISDDFEITQSMKDWFSKKGFQFSITDETQRFINHHIAKDSRFAEPERAWQNWMTGKFTPNTKKPNLKPENFAQKDYGKSTFMG
ncbi:helix-turn-helix domain-containing protein [Flavobacterium sp. W21_SRS_FM6]|uniref:helix-turn-helix domain-containing protein n=1 Tax=Flavobacterium sp. W21_SRS_FM6 TaxID=3240268 RepID=UPI003F93B856